MDTSKHITFININTARNVGSNLYIRIDLPDGTTPGQEKRIVITNESTNMNVAVHVGMTLDNGEGLMFFDKDQSMTLVWNGSAWSFTAGTGAYVLNVGQLLPHYTLQIGVPPLG